MGNGFNYSSILKPINSDINIVYNPSDSITSYVLRIYKDEKLIEEEILNEKFSKVLSETGKYTFEVTKTNDSGEISTEKNTYIIDKDKPIISVGSNLLEMKIGDKLDLFADVKALDKFDGDITNKITTNYDELDLTKAGIKRLVYTVSDEAGNVSQKLVTIKVHSNQEQNLLFIQSGIIVILCTIIVIIIKFKKSLAIEKRIGKYSIDPIIDNSKSLFDKLSIFYAEAMNNGSNLLSKSYFISKFAKKYDKYVINKKSIHKTGMHIVFTKIVVAIIFVMIAIFSKTIHYDVLNFYEAIIPLTVGFMAPDILLIYSYKVYRYHLENDLLQAIIIMNNAFKSGRSITQAIHLVTTELNGTISEEFKRMELELNFGLEIDIVFKRFSKRVQIEEVNYLTASLSILNKTGGNIIKVFSSIEKTLFNKKKLKVELESLTGTSKILVYVLFAVPILFTIFVSIISPSYFAPMLTTPIGLILTLFMICFYIIYIYFVKKIMKVRM